MVKKKQKEPLLYIQQPSFQFPKVKMQETYSSRRAEMQAKEQMLQSIDTDTKLTVGDKKKGESHVEKLIEADRANAPHLQKEVQAETKRTESAAIHSEKVQDKIEEFEIERRKREETSSFAFRTERKPAFNRLKGFKEMNITEQLHYLLEFPKQLPPVACIFETDEKTFRGFLISQTNDMIELKLFDGEIEKVRLETLKEIKMIGLRK
ncbi:CotO family spore coat protein [Cytobacillus sp. FJAT-53684]|uniref:CotO family spore coat protein n=1 Tax=Cytobacillus mangrovibacter TaxID=3299024 RepID=A0ABW6JX21_9BACI